MKKLAKNLLTILLVFALTASLVSAVSAQSSDKAKEIIEKTVNKYSDMLKKSGGSMTSFAAKMSIKGGGQVPMGGGGGGGGGSMPLNVNAAIEVYVSKPHNLYLEITGNLGNAAVVVGGEEKATATVILKGTNQFAVIDIPQDALNDIQKEEEVVNAGETERMEDFWKSVTVGYEGTENLKAGKAHKITLKPNDPEEKGSAIIHILDGKWDPARIEVVAEEGNAVIEFDMLEVNKDIPADKFVPQTAGMTPISQKDLTTALMMQLMTAMMQQGSQQ